MVGNPFYLLNMKKTFFLAVFVFVSMGIRAQVPAKVTITAKISNRNSDTLYVFGANNFRQNIPVNNKEIFKAAFEAPKGFYQFSDGKQVANLYVIPGGEIDITADAKDFSQTLSYKGVGANENNFLVQLIARNAKFQQEAFSKDAAEFTTLVEHKRVSDTELLEKDNLDTDFKTAIKSSFDQYFHYAYRMYEKNAKANEFRGKPSPDFDYENFKGGKTKLTDLKGKYVYIDLWATWCGPCRTEIPYLQKIEKKYHGKNIEFVSISIDKLKDQEKWRKFVETNNLSGIQLFADRDWESDFVTQYGVTGIPRFILLDPQGNIIESDAERPSSPNLQVQLDSLLN